jgi:hypothetical protein
MGVLALFTIFGLIAASLYYTKRAAQMAKDKDRKTYRLSFPADLDAERISAWLRSISGTLGKGAMFSGTPSITFELWASNDGLVHRMKVSWKHADYVISQLRSLIPGIRVTPEDTFPRHEWRRAVEVGITKSSRQLRIYSAADSSASILASAQALSPGESLLIQWVVSPAPVRHLPVLNEARTDDVKYSLAGKRTANRDEVKDRRDKLAEPNMLAVLRVAAAANTDERAEHLIDNVRKAFRSHHSPATKFYKRMMTKSQIVERISEARSSLIYPIQLSASELAALVAWPIGNPFIAGLPQSMARHLPATEQVPRDGRVIGRSNFPGSERPLAVSYVDARKHMHVVGPTGVGKTVLLANMMKQDIEQGYGVILIETKGDLFHAALNYVPKERVGDVIVMDINDVSRPVGFNILDQGSPKVVIDEITNLFEYLYQTNSVWTKEVLFHGLHTLATDPKLTFIDLAPLLVPMSQEDGEWRDALIRSLKDQELKNFWQRFDNQPRAAQDRITQPVMDRIWQLNARPELRNIIGQSKSSFTMREVVDGNKILLVNLSGLAGDTASLTGTLLMNALWDAVKTSDGTKTNFLYLDEFQDFLKLPVSPEELLAKARSFGLGAILAHQHTGQLPNELRQAVFANARSKVVFQTSAADAKTMAAEFGASVTPDDFMHLGKYEAIARVATGDGVSQPFSLATLEPARAHGNTGEVKYTSRERYGRAVQEIEQSIAQRRAVSEVTNHRPRPRISGADWGQ